MTVVMTGDWSLIHDVWHAVHTTQVVMIFAGVYYNMICDSLSHIWNDNEFTVQNFLILVRIAFWRSSYSSVVTPHSFRLCHLSNLSMHSERRVILFPGKTPGASADLFFPINDYFCGESKDSFLLSIDPCLPNNWAALVYISHHASLSACLLFLQPHSSCYGMKCGV